MSQEYEDLSLEELRDLCRERGLKVSGNKDELVGRLELADIEGDEEVAELEEATDPSTDVGEGDLDESDSQLDDQADDASDDEDDDEDREEEEQEQLEQLKETAPPAVARAVEPSVIAEERAERQAEEGGYEAPTARRATPTFAGEKVSSPFDYAVGPDGRKIPFADEPDESEEGES